MSSTYLKTRIDQFSPQMQQFKPWPCALDSFLSFFQDSFLSYFLDSFLSFFSDSFLSYFFRIVFYPIFGLNSIFFSDSLEKIAKNPKKDRIQSKNRIENYLKKIRQKTIQKKGQKTIQKQDRKLLSAVTIGNQITRSNYQRNL